MSDHDSFFETEKFNEVQRRKFATGDRVPCLTPIVGEEQNSRINPRKRNDITPCDPANLICQKADTLQRSRGATRQDPPTAAAIGRFENGSMGSNRIAGLSIDKLHIMQRGVFLPRRRIFRTKHW